MIENHVPDGTFVEAVAKLAKPEHKLLDIGHGQKLLVGYEEEVVYGDKRAPEPTPLFLTTLTGVVDAYKAKVNQDIDVLLQVMNPTYVRMVAPVVGDQRQQFTYVQCSPELPSFDSGRYAPMDLFILNVWTNFAQTEERARLLASAGSLSSGLKSDIVDDGLTQLVTTNRGVSRVGQEAFTNPVMLQPFRTFSEIEQPESPFVFRVKQVADDDGLTAAGALFEADGGAWCAIAIKRIGEYLREQLPDAVILA